MIANKGHEVNVILSSTIANQSTESLKSLCGQVLESYFCFLSSKEMGLSFFFGLVSFPRSKDVFLFRFFHLRASAKDFYLKLCQMRDVNNSK